MAIGDPTIDTHRADAEAPPIDGFLQFMASMLQCHRILLLGAVWLVSMGNDRGNNDTLQVCYFALAAVCVACATFLKVVKIKTPDQ